MGEVSARLAKIRGHLGAMGFDVSTFSDEELGEGVVGLHEAAHRFGLTTAEVLAFLARPNPGAGRGGQWPIPPSR